MSKCLWWHQRTQSKPTKTGGWTERSPPYSTSIYELWFFYCCYGDVTVWTTSSSSTSEDNIVVKSSPRKSSNHFPSPNQSVVCTCFSSVTWVTWTSGSARIRGTGRSHPPGMDNDGTMTCPVRTPSTSGCAKGDDRFTANTIARSGNSDPSDRRVATDFFESGQPPFLPTTQTGGTVCQWDNKWVQK